MSTKFYTLSISHVEQLTKDAVGVTFDVPSNLQQAFFYHQGQHLTLKTNINGSEVRRSYSICSSVVDQKLQVAIKCIDGGVFSNFAKNKFKVGMLIDVMPPQGRFFTELKAESKKHYLFISAGSGITPILSHIQSILELERKAKVTLIYGNKSVASTMFHNKLSLIETENSERFKRFNFYSCEQQKQNIYSGRITAQKIINLDLAGLIKIRDFSDVFLCGPQEMTSKVITSLKAWNFTDEHLHYELFYSDTASDNISNKKVEGISSDNRRKSRVSLKVNGQITTLDLAIDGDNILEAGVKQGVHLPFSCQVGVCATCKVKVTDGKVKMDVNHALTEEEVTDGFVLTCQSHPVSNDVVLDFDAD
ncbi:MAG: 2Fe-2S iron-sulfur cluster binding domain-containing protein [Alteromonadaceae bacterium]|nr:2Fe-2S iron-sulfur cluster binding domain-containing protein [Alteromonadaceae bacterium]